MSCGLGAGRARPFESHQRFILAPSCETGHDCAEYSFSHKVALVISYQAVSDERLLQLLILCSSVSMVIGSIASWDSPSCSAARMGTSLVLWFKVNNLTSNECEHGWTTEALGEQSEHHPKYQHQQWQRLILASGADLQSKPGELCGTGTPRKSGRVLRQPVNGLPAP